MVWVTVEVDLTTISTEEMVEELDRRGYDFFTDRELLEKIWIARRAGLDYQNELDVLIYNILGKVV